MTSVRRLVGRATEAPHATALVLLPITFLFLYGLVWQVVVRHHTTLDDRLFISAGQGVLSHGYPFETVHNPAGLPFFDHTPLYSYVVALPGAVAQQFGFGAGVFLARVMSAAFGLATVILVFFLGRDLRGTVSGVIAAVLVATNSYWVELAWVVHMEVPMAFFIVLGTYFIVHERMLAAGLAIATAVLLKEHAFAFWLVAGAFVLVRRGVRAALVVTLPSVIAFAVVVIAAYEINARSFRVVVDRWLVSAGGESPGNPRFHVSQRRWLRLVAQRIVTPPLGGVAILAAAIAILRRERVPAAVALPVAYSALAVIASFLFHLKEPRWLTAVIPMAALAAGTLVDWGAVARWLTRRDIGRGDRGAVPTA